MNTLPHATLSRVRNHRIITIPPLTDLIVLCAICTTVRRKEVRSRRYAQKNVAGINTFWWFSVLNVELVFASTWQKNTCSSAKQYWPSPQCHGDKAAPHLSAPPADCRPCQWCTSLQKHCTWQETYSEDKACGCLYVWDELFVRALVCFSIYHVTCHAAASCFCLLCRGAISREQPSSSSDELGVVKSRKLEFVASDSTTGPRSVVIHM